MGASAIKAHNLIRPAAHRRWPLQFGQNSLGCPYRRIGPNRTVLRELNRQIRNLIQVHSRGKHYLPLVAEVCGCRTLNFPRLDAVIVKDEAQLSAGRPSDQDAAVE